MRLSVMLALLMAAQAAQADQVKTAEAMLSPQFFQDDAGYTGCGVRVVVISASDIEVKGADFSLIVVARATLGAMFKAGGTRCQGPCSNPSQVKDFRASDYRLSNVSDGVPLKLLKTFPADNPIYTMGVADLVEAMGFLMKIVTGERMQLGFKPDGSEVRESFAFSATPMNAEEDASFNACMKAILKR